MLDYEPLFSAENDLSTGKVNWFKDGVLNASENCIDVHLETKGKIKKTYYINNLENIIFYLKKQQKIYILF